MGRHAQPLEILKSNGKSHHITKKVEEARKEAEIKLGMKDLSKLDVPAFIKNDVVAMRYWNKHIKEYKEAAKQGIELLSSSDVGSLVLYCKTYSEYESILVTKQKLETSEMKLDDIIKIETLINKKMDMLIKMQDRLFLNPLAKIKNVPKRETKKPSNPMEDEFGL